MAKQIWAAEIFTHSLSEDVKAKLLQGNYAAKPMFGSKRRGFEEVFVLHSGTQFVVFGVGDTIDPLLNFFIQDPELFQNVHFYRSTESSINLMFAISTGLCSPVKGGTQVLADIRSAHSSALQNGKIGLTLDSLIQQSLRVGKRIRRTTGLGDVSGAVVDSALGLAFTTAEHVTDISVLVIGAGEVARNAIEFLEKEGVTNVIVATASAHDAKQIENQFGVSIIDLEDINPFFQHADLVITEGPSDAFITQQMLDVCDSSQKKMIVDFGNACEFHAKLRERPLVTLYTLEDLHHTPATNPDLYLAVEEAWRLVDDEVKPFFGGLNSLEMVPVLSTCWHNVVVKSEDEISLLQTSCPPRGHDQYKMIHDNLLRAKLQTPFNPMWSHNLASDTLGDYNATIWKTFAGLIKKQLN